MKSCLQEGAKKWVAITAGTLLFCYYFTSFIQHLNSKINLMSQYFEKENLRRESFLKRILERGKVPMNGGVPVYRMNRLRFIIVV